MPKAKKQAVTGWRNRITGHDLVDADQLLAHPQNWRIHPQNQQSALSEVLDKVGWVQDVIVNQRTGFVVDGHLRISLAISKGEKVPVVYVDLTPEEEALVLASIDPLSAMAGTDQEKLNELLGQFTIEPGALADLLGGLGGGKAGLTDDDAVPEPQEAVVTRLGDCWRLGAHRLVCGDSTDIGCVERLMGGEKADMVFTDPPYGVDFSGAKYNPRAKAWAGIENDHRQGTDLKDFSLRWANSIVVFGESACPVYIWSAPMREGMAILDAIVEAGIHVQSQLVWVKNALALGQADYQWRHEVCWYGWTPGKNHYWAGGRALTTVWEHNKDANGSYVHPMQKPVSLSEQAINNSCRSDGRVLDIFAGSGSTLIGCEKTGRTARLMELDPKYCDVIVRRWQQFTGDVAILDGAGMAFDDVAMERAAVAA